MRKRSFPGFSAPNTTPVPDELFDELLPDLTGTELKVLLYIIRRTFGFKKLFDNISLNQMLKGLRTRDGRVLDRGAGVSKNSLLPALRRLQEMGAIIARRRHSRERGDEPTAYALRFRDPELNAPSAPEAPGGPSPQRGAPSVPGGGADNAPPRTPDSAPPGDPRTAPPSWPNNCATQDSVVQETERTTTTHAQLQSARVSPDKSTQTSVVVEQSSSVSRTELTAALGSLGLTNQAAARLLKTQDPHRIELWAHYVQHRLAQGWKPTESAAAYVVAAIRSAEWQVPEWFVSYHDEARQRRHLAAAEQEARERERMADEEAQATTRRRIEEALGVGERTRELWEETKRVLERNGHLHPSLLGAYLAPVKGRVAVLITPVPFLAEFIERHSGDVETALEEASGKRRVEVRVEAREDLLSS